MKRKLSLVTCIFLFALISNAYTQSLKEKIDSVVTQIEKKYSLSLYYNNVPDSVHSKHITFQIAPEQEYDQLLNFLVIFSEEFNKYPAKFINKVLKRIAVVKTLATRGNYRLAIPDSTANKVLYYDYTMLKYGMQYTRHIIHHEFYHRIDEEIYKTTFYNDSVWASFNGKEFKYGDGGNSCYNKSGNYTELIHPYKGFIDLYAMSWLEEDKAEIFSILFVESERVLVDEWMIKIKKDDILAKKVKYMKNFLHSICSEMNNKYWKNLE